MRALQTGSHLLVAALSLGHVHAFWRMVCGTIQTGRIDPVISPGSISGHCHTIAGAINLNKNSNYTTLQNSYCTSCSIQADKSGYWTPQLYYRHRNHTYEYVPHDGTVVYYLGRGVNNTNIVPFPPFYRVLSGDSGARAFDPLTMTYSNKQYGGMPVSNRVSFACLDSSGALPEQPYMFRTDCDGGLRAQIQFPSCWDGVNVYKSDQSHVAYMSGIDNGICPPDHPYQFIHIFFEIIYAVNNINKTDGGMFVFGNGDTTGYGFHGDFINGWDIPTLTNAINQCADTNDGSIPDCAPLAVSQDPYFNINCPEQPPQINETVKGLMNQLPGCNPPTGATARAAQNICPVQPFFNYVPSNTASYTRFIPKPGDMLGNWTYLGCTNDNTTLRPLSGVSYVDPGMTIDSCTAFCHSNGYVLAGLEYSTQCFCGTQLPPNNPLYSPLICSTFSYMVCGGNGLEQCGGPSLLQVWNDTSYAGGSIIGTPTIGVTTITVPSGLATYQGCYNEASGARALTGSQINNQTSMSLEMCGAYCQGRGYALFGAEFAYECFCGNSISTARLGEGNCTTPCAGSRGEYCGGASHLSVWSLPSYPQQSATGTATNGPAPPAGPTNPPGVAYIGCVSDSNPRVLAGYVSNNSISINLCAAVAQQKNVLYFGVEYSSQCLYGNTLSGAVVPLVSSKCYQPCAGSSQVCGGPNAISLYNNTLFVPPTIPNPVTITPNSQTIRYNFLACYSEPSGARALGANAQFTNYDSGANATMSVETCATVCWQKGYQYMGLENGNECFCNGAGVINGAQVSANGNADCNSVCVGNGAEFCGAAGKVQIYQRALS